MTDRNLGNEDLVSIQYLRGIAAVVVVYFHTGVNSANFSWPAALPRVFGEAGVDMFFVISGFVMVLVTSRRDMAPLDFLRRRVIRVVPLYWTVNAAIALAGSLYPAAMLENKIIWPHIAQSLLFIPHINPITGTTQPFFKLGWTLNYEMYFYAVFAVLLLVRPLALRLGLLALGGAACAMFFLAAQPRDPLLFVYTNPVMLEFVMGAGVAYAFVGGFVARLNANLGWPLVLAGSALIMFNPIEFNLVERFLFWGAPSALIAVGLLRAEAAGRA